MASKAGSGIDVSGMLEELQVIATDVEAANQGNAERRGATRKIQNRIDGLILLVADEETKSLFRDDDTSEDFDFRTDEMLSALDVLNSWSEALAPTQSGSTWDRNVVTAKMQGLVAFATAGLLSDEQVEQVNALGETFAANNLRTNGGVRSARTEQPTIEGRPATIQAISPAGEVIGNRKGNVKNSGSNVKTMVKEWAEKVQGSPLTDDQAKELLATANSVAETGESATWEGVEIVPSLPAE